MKKYIRLMTAVLAFLFVFTATFCSAEAEPASILGAPEIREYTETEDRFTNVLLLGIDYGFPGFWGSGMKRDGIEQCHADAFMVVSFNLTKDEVNLISIPRDTVTYVPGVRGLYKLNASVNCGKTFDEGLEHAKAAASWVLGGIEIDYFACLDMSAMIALGDYIGGVDMELEMSYSAGERYYVRGMQHLDGQGMMDYARARKNATVNYNDLGRTSRQRQVVTAIMKKLRSNASLIKRTWNYATGGEINFYTDLKLGTVLNLANNAAVSDKIGSYVMTGPYDRAMSWNFTYTDQENRLSVLREVFGIEAEELPLVSREYLNWMETYALDAIHSVNLGLSILEYGRKRPDLSAEDTATLDALEAAIDKTREAFFTAGATMETVYSTSPLYTACKELCALGDKAAAAVGFSEEKLSWRHYGQWNDDLYINEYHPDWA